MEGEWREVRLGEVARELTVGYVGSMTSEYTESGIPFLRSKNVDPLRINIDDLKFISGQFNEKISKSKLSPGDVVIVRTGKPGTCAVIPDWLEVANCSDLVIVRCGPEINNRFLAYYVNTVASTHVNAHLVGAVQQHFNVGSAKTMSLYLPPISVQTKIAHILGSLDNKIELNRQMNATLESMAQALFKSWFVDFDPVIDNALAAGNPIPEPFLARAKTRKALGDKRKPLPEAIQQQFPSSFAFTEEMGWVPEGWLPLPLNEAIVINPRVSLKIGSVAKYVDMKALPISGYTIDEVVEGKVYSGGAKFENGDVLLARITPCLENGKTGVVDFLDKKVPGFGSTEFIVLRSKGEIKTPFIAALARDEVFRRHCIVNMVGSSGRQRVQNSCFNSYYICRPAEGNILRQYHELCSAKFSKITSLKNEILSLTRLRDALLPKLLSGQLRIPDAEKLMADAL